MSRRRTNRQSSKLPAQRTDTESAQPPNRDSEGLERVSEHVSISQSFQGPLPPPGLLAKYNEAFPDCAERIVAMTEQQAAHRHALESRGGTETEAVRLFVASASTSIRRADPTGKSRTSPGTAGPNVASVLELRQGAEATTLRLP
ncbi:MAG: DUF2335 domain-containing protein [Acidobacteria bacterium]|nr:DUF2335 domain-containing protein [Acidobacteriota bacterium]MYD71087.1 DUF2335 domain-containing protein [Acidobacteriota bacterium]MYJ04313.1 DUF2335 domain-containing protein [Acidobacteriota bacterium]